MIAGINPKRELFKWGPIDGRPIYPDYWYYALVSFAKRFVSWPSFFMDVNNEKLFFVCEYQLLRDAGEKNFRKFILANKEFKKCCKEWQGILKEISGFLKEIKKEKVEKADNKQLLDLFERFCNIYHSFWTIGLLPEISNWGGEQMLKRELSRTIKNENEFKNAFEILSAPEDYSFYRKEELDLLKIKKLENNKKEFEKKLGEHQKKNFWLLNSYHHTQILPIAYFKKHLEEISLEEAEEKIRKMENYKHEATENKKQVIQQYKLGKEIEKISHKLGFCIWWQDERKKHIFIANHHLDILLDETAKRFKENPNVMRYYVTDEIIEFIKKNIKISETEKKKRLQYFLRTYDVESNTIHVFGGGEAEKMTRPYIHIEFDPNQKEFSGMVVSKGKGNAKGTVKIITSANEIDKIKKGDILVAPMTSPDFIVAMRKAIAIVTDEGGMTCHAAIVSRELGIPCIVATSIATKVLKDNDIVEVDAEKGIVRKINP